MVCLSHPHKKLITHLRNVEEIGMGLFKNKKGLRFPKSISSKKLQELLKIILYYHDIGKSTKYFQEYLVNGGKCEWPQKLTQHSLLSALIAVEKVKSTFSDSKQIFFAILAFLTIKKHHGNLENIDKMLGVSQKDWNIIRDQLNSICDNFKNHIINIEKEEIIEYVDDFLWEYEDILSFDTYFLINFLFSLLIYADKTDVVIGKSNFIRLPKEIHSFTDIYKKNKFGNNFETTPLNKLREKAYKEALNYLFQKYNDNKIFSLNLPTGIGKTLTALNLAFNMLKKDKNLQRIIYTFPFTSIIDQSGAILKDIFDKNNESSDDYITIHHHLSEIKIKSDDEYLDSDKAQFIIENWDTPLILTTFWQLFNSIITNKNALLRKFHNIANSVIILDEIQSIPYKYWKLVNRIFKKITEMFNCRIIFLTATMPLIFDPQKKEITPLIENREKYFSHFSRYKIEKINNLQDISIDELYEIAERDINLNSKKSFLFIFNTIKTSISFYKKIKERFPGKKIIYLSSNILPFERKKRIEEIKKSSNNKIIISTQVVEAGVDIDLDVVYRDFAPLDSIVQSAGRCNRNNRKEIGIVKLFKLKNNNGKYDYQYIYEGLTSILTESLFSENDVFYENELMELIDNYYKSIKTSSSKDTSNEILKAISELRYDDMVSEFKLIDDTNSFLMFFEIDKDATKVLKQFNHILLIDDRFKRKSEFLKIKKEFYNYVLSVRISKDTRDYKEAFEELGGFKIVKNDILDSVYDKETGLKREFDLFI